MTDEKNLLGEAEKLLETKPVKTWETLRRFGGLIFSFINFFIGIWYFLTKPQPENSPILLTIKAVIFSMSVCGALSIGLCLVRVARYIFMRKIGRLMWWDWILGVPIGAYLTIQMWYYHSLELLFIPFLTLGIGCFLILVVFPELHQRKIIDMNKPPPWEKKRDI